MIPQTLFADLAWSFHQPRYKDASWLVRAVTQFHTNAYRVAPAWQPDAIVLAQRHVRIQYGKAEITLRPARGEGFTAAELLFGVHQFAKPLLAESAAHYLARLELAIPPSIEPAAYALKTRYWVGAEAEQPTGPLPSEIMRDVLWTFTQPRETDRASFLATVVRYNAELDHSWDPDALAIPAPVILVSYWLPPDGRITRIPLTSEAPTGFTEGELLHRIHLACAAIVARYDGHFFEGLVLDSGATRDAPPHYKMLLGS